MAWGPLTSVLLSLTPPLTPPCRCALSQSKFVVDLSNNIYMPGGMDPNNNIGDSGNYNNGIGDVWFSGNMGVTWSRISQVTNVGYSSPVTLSTASYSCATLITGASPHRQIFVYSNWIEVYSATASVVSRGNGFGIPTAQCTCDSLTGIRSVVGDLVFPGESPNNLPTSPSSSSSSSSTTFSQGATAGIAIGVGLGVGLLCCVFFLVFFLGGRGGEHKGKGFSASSSPKHSHMEEEPSTNSTAQPSSPGGGVEMETRA